MNHDNTALRQLEARYERLLLLIGDMQAAIGRLQQLANDAGGSGQKSGGGGLIYSMTGVVIAAGSYVTGATVNALVGGSPTALPGTYTVYNQMQGPTVVTKTIMLGVNPDGTFMRDLAELLSHVMLRRLGYRGLRVRAAGMHKRCPVLPDSHRSLLCLRKQRPNIHPQHAVRRLDHIHPELVDGIDMAQLVCEFSRLGAYGRHEQARRVHLELLQLRGKLLCLGLSRQATSVQVHGIRLRPGYYIGYQTVPQTGYSGYSCTAFTCNYAVTSSQTWLYTSGVTSIAVTGSPGSSWCCQWQTNVKGCNGNSLGSNCTVNWWTSSAMTSLISTGLGSQLLGVGSTGSWYRQVSAPRFNTAAAAKTISACGTGDSVTLTVASGYYCMNGSGCGFPLPGILHCTFYYAGAQTFTYAAGVWTSSFTYLGVAYVLSIDTNGNLTCTANGADFSGDCGFSVDYCPVVGPFSGSIAIGGIGSWLGNGTITE